MNDIFYNEARIGIEKFFNNSFEISSFPSKLRDEFLNFYSNLFNYNEEGKKILAQVIFTNNIDGIRNSIKGAIKYEYFCDENEQYFDRRMKSLMPFCSEDWWMYVHVDNELNCIKYGIINVGNSITEPTFKDLIFINQKIKKQDDLEYILIEQASSHIINFSNKKGENLKVSFFIDSKHTNIEDHNREIMQLVDASFSKTKLTEKKLNEVKTMFAQIFKKILKKINGTICVVVDKDYVDKGFFADGTWLNEPINLTKLFNTKNVSEEKLRVIADLIPVMLNFDGITIVDNSGKIRAYNVFIQSDLSKSKSIVGGARKRAAYTIINTRKTKIVGVYFQSHEGEIFYQECKAYTSKIAKDRLKSNTIKENKENESNLIEKSDNKIKNNNDTMNIINNDNVE